MNFVTSLLNAAPGAVAQGLIWGIMAIGVYLTYRILDVADLTVDGTMSTGGCVAVILMIAGWNPWLALLVAFLSGMAAGFLTGFFHTRCGIPAILSGILTQLALYSINLRIMDGRSNTAISVMNYELLVSQRYVRSGNLNIFGSEYNPLPLLLAIVFVVILALYWFFGTERGASLRATGSNPNMARAQGINTNSNIVLGLMLSNGIVAVSGALLAQFQGGADVNNGRGAIVIGLAAVIIGEVLLGKIFRNFGLRLFSVVCGAVIYYLVIQVILLVPGSEGKKLIDTNDLKLITAVLVGLFLAIPYWTGKVFHAKKKGGKDNA